MFFEKAMKAMAEKVKLPIVSLVLKDMTILGARASQENKAWLQPKSTIYCFH